MSRASLIPTTAEELLLRLRESITKTQDPHSRAAAACIVKATDCEFVKSEPLSHLRSQSLFPQPAPAAIQDLYTTLQSQAQKIGSLPPAPHTVRGFVGSAALRTMNRLLWWHSQLQKDVALTLCELTRPLAQQYAEVNTATSHLKSRELQFQNVLDRLGKVEHLAQELQRSNTESRVVARFEGRMSSLEHSLDVLRNASADTTLQSLTAQIQKIASDLVTETETRESLQADLKAVELEVCQDIQPRLTTTEGNIHSYKDHNSSLEQHLHFSSTRIAGVESTLQFMMTRLTAVEASAQALAVEVQKLWGGLSAEMAAREATDKRALNALETAIEAAEPQLTSASTKMPDVVYLALQERFRGSQSQIRSRQREYLPILKESGVGTPDKPILDVGCGRGEWLQVLQSEMLAARGVDSNVTMVDACAALDLQVTKQDALVHLAGLPAESVGAITSFHVVEHLAFKSVVQLVEHAFRILKPGGLLIIETPNPANIRVGTHTFYLDPTHVKPIPSELLWFIFELQGFRNLRLLELHPPAPPAGTDVNVPDDIARAFRTGLDYSIVGERP